MASFSAIIGGSRDLPIASFSEEMTMTTDIRELMKKPAEDLSADEMRMIAAYKEEQEQEARHQQLDAIHKEQQRVKKRVEALEGQLAEKKAELKDLETQAASLARKPSMRSIGTLKDDSLTDMITMALHEAGKPLGVAEVYEQIQGQRMGHNGATGSHYFSNAFFTCSAA